MSEPSIKDYTIGWICALQEEYEAACRMLDNEFDCSVTGEVNDNNTYVFGCVNKHNVVIACLPNGRYGISSAASIARDMVRSFPNLRFALMVGIGGGAPTRERDIRLGDVVVSVPQGKLGGVVQYDFGKRLSDGRFQINSQLNAPPEELLGVIPEMQRRHNDPRKPDKISEHLRLMQDISGYQRPANDLLYRANYKHKGGKNCEKCEADGLEGRPPRETRCGVTVHYGIIASANSVMKNAAERDQFAGDPELNVLCFEMEAGGLMNNFPCLVVRGICDYSDSHKNDEWHKYAALTAAAYTRELLHVLKPRKVAVMPSWAGRMECLLSGIQERVSEIARKADNIINYQHSQEEEKILEWLTTVDYARQQNDHIRRRQAGTGQWLLDSTEYLTWLNADKQTLFCPGIPGAGKTIMTSIIVEDIRMRFRNDASIGVAYIYCNFGRQQEQKPDDLLASLLKQLIWEQFPIPESTKSLFVRHKGRHTRPSLDEYLKVLHSIVASYSRTFIIIDALDECQISNGGCMKFLSEIFNLQAKTGANLFATSRIIPEIGKMFEQSISLEIYAKNEDIQRYLDSRMSQLPGFVLRSLDLQEEIKTKIIKAVDGMFLLAQLFLDSLIGKISPKAIRTALNMLPIGSDAYDYAYNKAMERIEGQVSHSKELAKRVISWITCAKRLLTTSELLHALAVEIDEFEFDKENLSEIEDVVSVCVGLVTVDKESDIIRLVHYTTQDYFRRTQKHWFPNAEADIAITCVKYLSFSTFKSGPCVTDKEFEERLQLNPFYDYAAKNWGYHARIAAVEIDQLILAFFESEPTISASCQAMLASRDYEGYSQRVPKFVTGVHLTAYFGLSKAMVSLLNDGYYPDLRDSYGWTPLSWAARQGYESIVDQLLAIRDVDPDSTDNYGRTPLSWAAEKGHKVVVGLLVNKRGVDLNSKDVRNGQTPLSLAAENGYEEVVTLLLNMKGVDLDSKDIEYGQTPLSWAVEHGHEKIVKLLLATEGIDVNSENKYSQTPLWFAMENGDEAIIKLLLADSKINPNIKNMDGQTPLSWASEKGHERIVKLLLANSGVDTNVKSKDCQTPLLWAVENRHEVVAKLLLADRRVNPNIKSKNGQSPLSCAAANGLETMVKLLLENGADLESESSNGQTPLLWAALKGHKAVVELLLKNGAKLETKDSRYGQTPLPRAAVNGHEAVVKLLLEKGAEMETKDSDSQTPLSLAAGNGHEAVVRLLLENGAELETRDGHNGTPLSLAAKNGHEVVVKLLLEKSAELETRDRSGWTPLSLTAMNGHEAVVRQLLEKGAELETVDMIYRRTPLLLAAMNGHEAVVKLLLEKGTELETKDSYGQMLLSLAAMNGHEAVVNLLREKDAINGNS